MKISRCADAIEAASFFLDKGVGLVVVTKGGGGALAMSRGGGSETGGGDGDVEGARGLLQKVWEQKCPAVEVRGTGLAVDTGGGRLRARVLKMGLHKRVQEEVEIFCQFCSSFLFSSCTVRSSPRLLLHDDTHLR